MIGNDNRIFFGKAIGLEMECHKNFFLCCSLLVANLTAKLKNLAPQGWDQTLRRLLCEWEVIVWLNYRVSGKLGTKIEDDTVRWNHQSDGVFTLSRRIQGEYMNWQEFQLAKFV